MNNQPIPRRPRAPYAAAAAAQRANEKAAALGLPDRLRKVDVEALWERQPACVECGQGRGVDHIRDMTAGGPNTSDNLQNLCQPCNSRKHQRTRRKLSAEQVTQLRARRLAGESYAALGRAFGVATYAAWQVVNGVTYQEVG